MLNAILRSVLLVKARTPLKAEPTGVFVNRMKVFDELAGICVAKICGCREGFNPVLSSLVAGKVPSGLKFKAEANVITLGLSEALLFVKTGKRIMSLPEAARGPT
jgi:hypothetical protein